MPAIVDAVGKLPGNQEGEDALESLSELKAQWTQLDQRWCDYMNGLTADDLDAVVIKVSTSSGIGIRHATTVADVLLHVSTHARYTTAQAINMMRHAGLDQLPDSMLISMAREESGR